MVSVATYWFSSENLSPAALTALVALAVLLLGAAIIFRIWVNRKGHRATECLRRQVLKRSGTFSNKTLSFAHEDVAIDVSWSFGRENLSDYTYVMLRTNYFPDKNFRIVSKNKQSFFEMAFGSPNLLMLEGFVVQSNDEPFIRFLLTEEIKDDLLRYQQGLEIVFGRIDLKNSLSSSSAIDQDPGCFFFALKKIATDDRDYDALIETSIRFHERLKGMAHGAAQQRL